MFFVQLRVSEKAILVTCSPGYCAFVELGTWTVYSDFYGMAGDSVLQGGMSTTIFAKFVSLIVLVMCGIWVV